MDEYYITINEAAYLMGFSVDTVKKMIENGELLCRKGTNPILIHDSEIGRFQHPWKHIFRLDQRINAQQELIEKLKPEINRTGLDVQVNDLQFALRELEKEVASMKSSVQQLMDHFPSLVETVSALMAKQAKPLLRKKKKQPSIWKD